MEFRFVPEIFRARALLSKILKFAILSATKITIEIADHYSTKFLPQVVILQLLEGTIILLSLGLNFSAKTIVSVCYCSVTGLWLSYYRVVAIELIEDDHYL